MSTSRLLLILYLLVQALALDRVTSVVNGVAEYTGQPVDVYNPLPTLIYNCYNLPSICANVQDYLNDNNIVMGNGLDFHYDSFSKSTKKRRNQSCRTNERWTSDLPFPCGSDPAQPSVMPGNLPARVGPLTTWQNPEFRMEIPNLFGTGPSGMRYTCDEFPAASWIEGGVNNLPPYTSIYCAPKAVSCESDTWAAVLLQNPNYPNRQSEQDWQGNAHSMLGAYGKDRSPWLTPVMKFHFTTTNLGAGSVATAAQIVMPAYNGNPDTTDVAGTKRDVNLDVNGRFHCTGKFCGALKKAGFSFDEPASPSPSFQMLKVADSGTEPESPHATIHVLTS
ncbi:hypothetical protein ATEIFO6365_0006078700 [Aspergillus terreus]|uniref:Uncharacterized protein n=1 Tax=Aspergillus terreus TaxID=33178 RepID=A0A5M3YZ75_ASPTE|nr:hypothetical protein ATETN484_0005078700 [Aspergillus terreus]GFF17439.1 hypothetical protein ATEIFO6365_0006078700 [Aspergillus terreus]